MKLLVCGGRDFVGRDLLYMALHSAVLHGGCTEIICGYDPDDKRFQGADQLAYEWAREFDFPCRTFPAAWGQYGRSAGPRRNSQMAADRPEECAAFPRANGEWGSGTLDMIGKAAAAGAKVHRFDTPDGVGRAPRPHPVGSEQRSGPNTQASRLHLEGEK